jgi:hypothetical protein
MDVLEAGIQFQPWAVSRKRFVRESFGTGKAWACGQRRWLFRSRFWIESWTQSLTNTLF